MRAPKRCNILAVLVLVAVNTVVAAIKSRAEPSVQIWHFAPNGNFDETGTFTPAQAGFNLADVSSRRELDLLPDGTKGLVWVGQCDGVTKKFENAVGPLTAHPKAFGFYLMDDPDPRGFWRPRCRTSDLRAESDWIHRRRPNAVTFVALMNMGTSASPKFSAEYAPKISHVDLFGIAPYPCRTDWSVCDYEMIDRFVAASRKAGFPQSKIVPIFQSFGGGAWRDDSGGAYRLPNLSELHSILDRWDRIAPAPAFDFAYSWGQQRSDESLAASADLQAEFARHNRETQTPGRNPQKGKRIVTGYTKGPAGD